MLSEDIKECLHTIVESAIQTYDQSYSSLRHIHTKIARASIINSHIVAGAKALAAEKAELEVIELRNTTILQVNCPSGKALIKFKKLNRYLQTSNNFTQQALSFVEQKPIVQLELPGILDSHTNLVVGYRLNLAGQLDGIFLLCPFDRYSHKWVEELNSQTRNISNLIQLPILPNVSNDEPRYRLKDAEKASAKIRSNENDV